jgi:hypothetical protein
MAHTETDLILLQVHVPLHVHNCHWHLVVFNFEEETQILNSSQAYRDEAKEAILVSVFLKPLTIMWNQNYQTTNETLCTTNRTPGEEHPMVHQQSCR